MQSKNLINPVNNDNTKFTDSYHYYRFKEDDIDESVLGLLSIYTYNIYIYII